MITTNNTTIVESYPNLDNAVTISIIIWRSCGILCTLFGIPGHLFLIIITTNKTNRKEPTTFYYSAIAICEIIFLLGVFWLWCVGMSIIKTDPRQILSCGLFYSLLMGPTILSNLYMASMFLDRTYMIIYPTRYRLVITRRHVLTRLFSILIIIIIVMIPHHYYYYYQKATVIFICQIRTSIIRWKIGIWPFLHAILFVLVPSIITCISSLILLHNRCNHRRIHKNKISETARRMERSSILIVFATITIFFSILPFVILEIFMTYDHLFNHGIISPMKWRTYKILLNWFLALGAINYSFKFYFHLLVSTPFRKEFIQLFNCLFQGQEKTNEHILVPLNSQNRTASTQIQSMD